MKRFLYLSIILLIGASCSEPKRERFNYTLIKSMLDLTTEQTEKFDEITAIYTKRGKETYEKFHADKERLQLELQQVGEHQDSAMKEILKDNQYAIYEREIKIEREGREQHNMKLIKETLALDSAQQSKFDLANEAFYKTLVDNHDNYHGKPDVYVQYYQQLDVSRKETFKEFLSLEQYNRYLELAKQYNIGRSEH